MPGIENVGKKAPKNSQLRYFRKSENSEADEIVRIIKGFGIDDMEARYIPGYADSSNSNIRQYEIWFGIKF